MKILTSQFISWENSIFSLEILVQKHRRWEVFFAKCGSKSQTVGGLFSKLWFKNTDGGRSFFLNVVQNHRRWEAFFRNYGSKIRTWRDLFHDWLTHLVLHVLCFSRVHPHSLNRLVLHVLYFIKIRLNALVLHVLW